jgi:chemotaxis protein methyltransferase CheR
MRVVAVSDMWGRGLEHHRANRAEASTDVNERNSSRGAQITASPVVNHDHAFGPASCGEPVRQWYAGGSATGRKNPGGPNLKDSEARDLIALIYEHSGIVLTLDKKHLISSRLNKRVRKLGLRSFRTYLDYLRYSPEHDIEMVSMIDEITTNKTEFFREHQHFDFLISNILPGLVTSEWSTLSFWCAGCSTGEEPYSLAMVLAEYFGTTRNFNIFATDLSTQALRTAYRAIYANDLGASIPFGLRQKYTLTGHGSQTGKFRIAPELRGRVTFDQLNLIASDWKIPRTVNIVFCRNTMIYFDQKTRGEIIARFRRHLKPDGYLFIGHSESLGGFERKLGFVQVRPTVYALRQ